MQACGCTAGEAHQLVDYVYGRPVGEPAQEVGGVMVTLAALCLANGLDMHANAETELARIWTKVEAIRAKQAAKPKHSPLPAALAPATPAASVDTAIIFESEPLREKLEEYFQGLNFGTREMLGAIDVWQRAHTARAVAAAEQAGFVSGYTKATVEHNQRVACTPEPAAPQQHAQAALSDDVIDHCWKMYQQGQISADHTAKEVFAQTQQSLATWIASHQPAAPQQHAQAALSDERESQTVTQLRKSLAGWQEECETLRRDRDGLRQRLDLQALRQKNDVWYWQGDGTDHPESISNSMAVVIRGDQLRAILAASHQPAAAPAQPEVKP